MGRRCQRTRIEIPNDTGFRPMVGDYAAALAEHWGFSTTVAGRIRKAVEEALGIVFDFAFENGQRGRVDLIFERADGGIRIVLHDEGLPLDPGVSGAVEGDPSEACDVDGPCARLFALRRWVEEVRFDQLGHRGKSITLVQPAVEGDPSWQDDACPAEEPDAGPGYEPLPERDGEAIAVRAMAPTEAVAVARCIYKSYGYTYPYHHVYDPRKIAAMNREGTLYSALAVDAAGEVAGHCALQFHEGEPMIAEMAQGAVAPEYRSLGILQRLTEHLLGEARRRRLLGVYARPVTLHDRSQRVGHRYGMTDCGLQLAMIPGKTRFAAMPQSDGERVSMMLQFRYLNPPKTLAIHCPSRHRDMIVRLYQRLGVPHLPRSIHRTRRRLQGSPHFRVRVVDAMRYACIEITAYGKGMVQIAANRLQELCLQRIEVIHLFLDLFDARTAAAAEDFERIGFFFSGILPGGLRGRDALILQYLNNVAITQKAIRTHSSLAADLVSYVFQQGRHAGVLHGR